MLKTKNNHGEVFMRIRGIVTYLAMSAIFTGVSYADIESLTKDFTNPPDKSCAETWYHFTSNAITKEGITADIEAMRDIGYKTAHVFGIGSYTHVPGFDIKVGDEKWRDLMRHLGAEAKRCGISLGMHNCPGWSSSGGPWIKPEDSMKKVTASETFVNAPFKGKVKLPQPETVAGFYRDIAVIALPSEGKMPTPKVFSDIKGGEKILNNQSCTLPVKEKTGKGSFTYEFEKPFAARTAKIIFDDRHVFLGVDVLASDDSRNFKKIAFYKVDSFCDLGLPHYVPLGENVKYKYYKFVFRNTGFPEWFSPRDLHVREISLLSDSMIKDAGKKVSMGKPYKYAAPEKGALGGADREKIKFFKADKNGEVSLDLKEGCWKILRIGYTSTGATNQPTNVSGLECDKLSKRGLDAHWPYYMAKMQADFNGALKNATIDSYEVSGQNWTEDFAEQFKARRGYDIMPWLPVMAGYPVGSPEEISKFCFDVQVTVAELFAENYFDYFSQLCKKNGLTSIAEPYGGPFDYFRCVRNIDFPATEFWIGEKPPSKAVASMANVYGKPRAGTESFTTMFDEGRWQQDPRQLKEYGDRAWAQGVSEFVMHTYVHQPFNAGPGFSLGKHGSHLNRLNTWWKMGDAWISYVNRSQVLLQRGKFLADVLLLPPQDNPNGLFYTVGDAEKICDAGYAYNICSNFDLGEVLYVENGKVKAAKDGSEHSLLLLPDSKYMSVKKLKALAKLIKDGASVAALKPRNTISLSDDKNEFDALVNEIWGSGGESFRKIGKGSLYVSANALDVLEKMKIKPRVSAGKIKTLARRDGDIDIFYLLNRSECKVNREVSFAIPEGKIPQIWNPADGSIENAPQWKREGDGIKIPFEFDANESKFVVFVKGNAPAVADFKSSLEPAKDFEPKIIEARYGEQKLKLVKDVKNIVEKNLKSGLTVGNSAFGGDPAPMKPKSLYVKYAVDGKTCESDVPEGMDFYVSGGGTANIPNVRPTYFNGKLSLKFEVNAEATGTLSDGSIFRKSVTDLPKAKNISSDWKVEFQKNRGAPDSILLKKLHSVSECENEGIKYFSGEMVYSKTVEIPAEFIKRNRTVKLAFDEIYNVAQVSVNGENVAVLWTPPFECDITKFIKEGENKLSVRVANLWVNRIIGDQLLPVENYPKWVLENKTVSETKRFTSSHWHNSWPKNSPLKKSGIVGTAEIKAVDIIPLK